MGPCCTDASRCAASFRPSEARPFRRPPCPLAPPRGPPRPFPLTTCTLLDTQCCQLRLTTHFQRHGNSANAGRCHRCRQCRRCHTLAALARPTSRPNLTQGAAASSSRSSSAGELVQCQPSLQGGKQRRGRCGGGRRAGGRPVRLARRPSTARVPASLQISIRVNGTPGGSHRQPRTAVRGMG